jgi:hypothetical protein
MAGAKSPKVKSPAQMKAEMAVGRARDVLPKAEREINLGNMLRESAVKERMYHASPHYYDDDMGYIKTAPDEGISSFKLPEDLKKMGSETDPTANALFMTPSYEFANKFSGTNIPDPLARPAIYPMYVQAKNPFDYENPKHIENLRSYLIEHRPNDIDDDAIVEYIKHLGNPKTESNWTSIENPEIQESIKELGHDSFYAKEKGVKNLGVYNPNAVKSAIGNRGTYDLSESDINKARGGIVKMAEGGTPDREFIDRMREEFSVYNKPTYGNEIPGTPTIDQQRYELTMKGRQEAENRARTTRDSLTAMDPSGTLGIVDALKTVGKAVVAPIAYVGGNAFDWLQTGKVDPAKSKARGEKLENWMTPKTQEGGELLEEIGKVGPAITGSEMGFGMHPNLWASGIGLTTPKQTAAGLRLGAERVAPFAKDVGSMASELYMSGKMPGMVAPNMYAVAPDGKPSKVLAPANESGFYSPTEAAALNLQRKSGAGQAFLNDIMKGENVKADEIKTMGLDTFLKDKKNVTADEVRDYIAQNKIQLGESVYGYRRPPEAKPESPEDFLRFENLGEEIDSARNFEAETKAPKFESYALPGGENYREIVLTLPSKIDTSDYKITGSGNSWYLRDADNNILEAFGSKEQAEKTMETRASLKQPDTYKSSHWDEANPLAHLRVSDRVTDGKKTLLVDEVQSDWHQAGRDKGYVDPNAKTSLQLERELNIVEQKRKQLLNEAEALPDSEMEKFNKLMEESRNLTDQARDLYEQFDASVGNQYKVPDAPYKDDWYQLTLRRAIKEAIDGGYDRVALPTGARVADRFDLSKQVDSIAWEKNPDGTYTITPEKDGNNLTAPQTATKEKLAGIIGKDVANKITSSTDNDGYLSGLDLKVGGEGMKKYYDEIYPSYLKKFGKKYGANVGTTYAKTDIQEWPFPIQIESDGKNFWLYGQDPRIDAKKAKLSGNFSSYEDANKFRDSMYEGNTEPLHYMDITPAMRKEFSTGIPMKRGGKVQFANNIDAMRLALSKG